MTYVTFMKWENKERMHEHYDIEDTRVLVSNLDLTKVKAVTHVYNNERKLVDYINWNEQ